MWLEMIGDYLYGLSKICCSLHAGVLQTKPLTELN